MSRFTRVLAAMFPSVPPSDLGIVLAAMEGDTTQAPAVGAWGSASAAGGTPEGEGLVHQSDPRDLERTAPAPSGPPSCEVDLYWRPHPALTHEFTDGWLAHLLDRWTQEAQP